MRAGRNGPASCFFSFVNSPAGLSLETHSGGLSRGRAPGRTIAAVLDRAAVTLAAPSASIACRFVMSRHVFPPKEPTSPAVAPAVGGPFFSRPRYPVSAAPVLLDGRVHLTVNMLGSLPK